MGMRIENANKQNSTNANAIAIAMAIKSLKFSSEIMVLIKHLLVACLLREYEVRRTGKIT